MSDQLHPIRVAAARSGLTPDLLRAWEKRYEAVEPRRMDGRRLYSEADIERLVLLRRATLAGRRIGDIAALSTADLRALDEDDRQALAAAPVRRGPAAPGPAAGGSPEAFRRQCLAAIAAFDAPALERTLDQAAVALGQAKLLDEVIVPFIRSVGEMWRQGEVRVAQEHLCTAVLQTFLAGMRNAQVPGAGAPILVVATLPGQLHELGALVVAATAAAEGWQVAYLGPSLPIEEIAAAAQRLAARAIALSLIYPADDPRLGGQFEKLRGLLPERIALIVGGSAAAGYQEAIEGSGALHLQDMTALRSSLAALRMAPQRPAGSSPADPGSRPA